MRIEHKFYTESKEQTARIEEEVELEKNKMSEDECAAELEKTKQEADDLLSRIKRKERAMLCIPNEEKMHHFHVLANLAVIFAYWSDCDIEANDESGDMGEIVLRGENFLYLSEKRTDHVFRDILMEMIGTADYIWSFVEADTVKTVFKYSLGNTAYMKSLL